MFPRSRVRHSTAEQLRLHNKFVTALLHILPLTEANLLSKRDLDQVKHQHGTLRFVVFLGPGDFCTTASSVSLVHLHIYLANELRQRGVIKAD